MSDFQERFPVTMPQIVRWGDMDAFGHVNNTVFFRYFESARIAYFDRIGWWEVQQKTGIGPILADTSCRFRRPLTYPDTLQVGTSVRDLGKDRFQMDYVIWSEKLQTVAAEGTSLIVSYHYGEHHKAPLPTELREAIERLESAHPRHED